MVEYLCTAFIVIGQCGDRDGAYRDSVRDGKRNSSLFDRFTDAYLTSGTAVHISYSVLAFSGLLIIILRAEHISL